LGEPNALIVADRDTGVTAGIRSRFTCSQIELFVMSFIGSYKTEEFYRHEYRGLAEAMTRRETYGAWYREDRLHQALAYQSPLDYAKSATRSILLVA